VFYSQELAGLALLLAFERVLSVGLASALAAC
jgi:hypothetical protein